MEGSEVYGQRYVDFQETLIKRITSVFTNHVQPRSVLHIIHSISEKVLTRADIQYIRSVADRKGDIEASHVLLECLKVYENWWPCTLKLLEHHEVKLPHVAKVLKEIHEQVVDIYYPELPSTIDQDQNQATYPVPRPPPSRGPQQNPNRGDRQANISHQESLKSAISFLFAHHVNLHLFLRTLSCISCDQKIQYDRDMVKTIAEVSGEDTAKRVLVDCITANKEWFPCLLQVFNHPDMDCKQLANFVQMIHRNPMNAGGGQILAENYTLRSMQSTKDPLSTMDLVTDSVVNPTTAAIPKGYSSSVAGDISSASFQHRLKEAIKHTFAAYVDINKFLNIIPKIDKEVSKVVDELEIKAIAKADGRISAAYHLLDNIVKYKGWFSFLLKALKHPEMNLSRVADQIKTIQDDTYKKFQEEKENSTPPKAGTLATDDVLRTSEGNVNVLKAKRTEKSEHRTSLLFNQQLKVAIASHFVHHIRPNVVLHFLSRSDQDILTLADRERVWLTARYEGEKEAAYQLLDCLVVYREWFPCLLQVLRHHEVKLHHVATKFEEIYETTKNGEATSDDQALSLEEETYAPETPKEERCSKSLHKSGKTKQPRPEYDFTHVETSKAMRTLAGWHEGVPDKMVEDRLQKLISSDGHYILWYWERRKRPAICVTYKNKIKTFVVHKQISTENRATMYYIDRNGRHDADLLNLIEFHLRKGLPDATNKEDRILFFEPVPSMD